VTKTRKNTSGRNKNLKKLSLLSTGRKKILGWVGGDLPFDKEAE